MSLWLPMWPIDVIRRAMRRTAAGDGGPAASFSGSLSARPVLLWSAHAGAQRVEACCDRCGRRGIVPGMGVAHARALLTRAEVDAIVFEPHDPARDAAALHRLAVWAMRFSPLVAIDTSHRSHGLWLDVSGCARLFGGEERLLRRLVRHLARFGVEGRAAMAPTFAAAAALARFGTIAVCDEASLRSALAPLPIEALRIDASIVEALHEVNVRRIDELIDLPRRQLAERFGLMLLRRIDETLGRVPELLEPIAVPPALRVEPSSRDRRPAARRSSSGHPAEEIRTACAPSFAALGRARVGSSSRSERPRGACDALALITHGARLGSARTAA
ncbi:MAG: DNA polymerase Y family protein [Phycisphaerales bacterium]